MHEWRAAVRSLVRRPSVALTIVLTLALGIGANSAIFSAVDVVLLKPLPYPAADRLVSVYESNLTRKDARQLVAPVRIEEWNARNVTFDGLAASYFENLSDTSGALPERIAAMRISPRFFTVLGVSPQLGRTPTAEEERFGGEAVAVVSEAFWRRRWNGDPSAVGAHLTLGGRSYTVIGVMPPSFRYPSATTDVWLPTQAPRVLLEARRARFYAAFGRLKPGVGVERARADLDAIQARLGELFPETDKGWGATLIPLKEEQVGGVRRSMWLLLGAVSLVLLAACTNVACLLLADAARREYEVGVRFALGANRRSIVAQLLREGAALALAGAAVGVVVARVAVSLLRAAATGVPRLDELRVDARLVAFTLAIGLATTLLFALAPALLATRRDAADTLSRGRRGAVGGRHRLPRALVSLQMALAIVLLVGAGLLVRSFVRLQHVSTGFDPDRVLTFRMSAQWSERTDAVVQRQARTVNALEAIRGVDAAAFSEAMPGGADYPPGEFHIVGRDPADKPMASMRAVSAGYFRVLRVPLLEGDTCSRDPSTPAFSQTLVTRAFVDTYFANENAIGHSLTIPNLPPATSARIVGVVGDVRERGVAAPLEPIVYWCGFSPYWPDPYFLVRTNALHPASVNDIRAALRAIEPQRAVYSVRALPEVVADAVSQRQLLTTLVALFALMTLGLASVGLYGVLSQFVAARRRDIGIRIALGAPPARILRSVASQATVVVALGAGTGLAGASMLTRFMTTLVFGIRPDDPVTFAAVPIVLAVVTAATALGPARRATRIDPTVALRDD